jgi:hypothetical protein
MGCSDSARHWPLQAPHLELCAGIVVDQLQPRGFKCRLVHLQVLVAEVTHHLQAGGGLRGQALPGGAGVGVAQTWLSPLAMRRAAAG